MKKFSDRINADWHSVERLKELLDEFFADEDGPKTLPHLYCWLNTDWAEMLKRSMINENYKKLITAAENECETWVIDHMLENDKSSGKYIHQTFHNKESGSISAVPTIKFQMVSDDL